MQPVENVQEARVIANYAALCRFFGGRFSHGRVVNTPELELVVTDFRHPVANVVSRTSWLDDLPDAVVRARVEMTLQVFAQRSVPVCWRVWPSTTPASLASHLLAVGFVREVGDPGMTLDLRTWQMPAPVPAGLRIEQIADAASQQVWVDTLIAGFGFPDHIRPMMREVAAAMGASAPFTNYLGWHENVPVAVASAFVHDGVAGIYNVAPLASARRMGIGAAVTAQALQQAREQGCHTAMLLSSEMGLPVYQRLGFTICCTVEDYIWYPADMRRTPE